MNTSFPLTVRLFQTFGACLWRGFAVYSCEKRLFHQGGPFQIRGHVEYHSELWRVKAAPQMPLQSSTSGSTAECSTLADHVACCRYIACLVTDGRRDFSSVQIFEARDLASGPICKVNLRKMLPMAFHCAWSETAFA